MVVPFQCRAGRRRWGRWSGWRGITGGYSGRGSGQQLVDQGAPGTHLALEIPFTLPARTNDLFETHGLTREFLTHSPTEKALLMIDADFGHIPGVIPDSHVFPHIGRQRGIN
jgi:hypothetical protein